MKRETLDNVWTALEKSEADAAVMNMKSELMTMIEHAIERRKLPQAEAASRLGITRSRLNDLLRGKISKFSLDALIAIATRAGLSVSLSVKRVAGKRAA